MKKMEGRAMLCLLLSAVLVIGTVIFGVRFVRDGDEWASFYANAHVYSGGKLAVGTVYDRNGEILLKNDSEGPHYNDDSVVRKATMQVVGDPDMNVSTGVNYAFRKEIIGYNILTGSNGFLFADNREVNLTIDAEVSGVAYEALGNRDGFVGVYNWKTGEIICMVSKPTYDPAYPEQAKDAESGSYINKVLSAAATPGSTFKLVTTAAAIENKPDLDSWSFRCSGTHIIDGEKVTCQSAHGNVDIYGALSKSCNCAYAALTLELGSDVMNSMVEQLRLTDSYDINGIKSMPGTFNFDTYNINLGWAGVGQFEDKVNPLSMMVYMGSIAGGGSAASPVLKMGSSSETVELIDSDTALKMDALMRNNVTSNYGDGNYPGLELRAKSGTAEGGPGRSPDAWFCGYSGDFAFVVCVEKGGYGSAVAGPVANKVLQAIAAK
ncbi:MAG: penicillin-binding protein [Clostridiales bacterium]|nr:penicillin-binding protein [Bacillota bacterium]MEE0517237.1 penicillin-binding transpeptidase domain-containing protein [Anaerovoracaceae bacterium]PWL93844.1 MAG: penicillin-binding protein [Clostridiales bacterium]